MSLEHLIENIPEEAIEAQGEEATYHLGPCNKLVASKLEREQSSGPPTPDQCSFPHDSLDHRAFLAPELCLKFLPGKGLICQKVIFPGSFRRLLETPDVK